MMMKPNLERQYAHEVVTAAAHNEVCNLSVAQRARDQAEIIREQRDELLAALSLCSQYFAEIDTMQPGKVHGNVGDQVRATVSAAVAKARA